MAAAITEGGLEISGNVVRCRMRKGQSTVEYMLTIATLSLAVAALLLGLGKTISGSAISLGSSMATSLTTDGVQP